jgi:outer membrane lipoprotein-sorting protein
MQGMAQTAELTAEQILEKNIEATGGKAAYEAQKSQVMAGELNMAAAGMKGTILTYSKGNKILVITEIPGLVTQKQGFDGKIAWTEDTLSGLRKLEGAEKDSVIRSASNSTINWKDFYKEVKLAGKEKVGDREAYVVEMTPKTGEPQKSYYDAETFMVIRTVTKVKSPQGTFETDMAFADYRDEGGVKMAHKMTMKIGPSDVEITIVKVKINVPIDDAKFAYPGTKTANTKTKQK